MYFFLRRHVFSRPPTISEEELCLEERIGIRSAFVGPNISHSIPAGDLCSLDHVPSIFSVYIYTVSCPIKAKGHKSNLEKMKDLNGASY